MKFIKMHGCGNDYVFVDCMKEKIEMKQSEKVQLARNMSDRHYGVGSDGLIFICSSDQADFYMEMYNADGSIGEMCGNGIRCLGKYVYAEGYVDHPEFTVDTKAGIKTLTVNCDGSVTVDMGEPYTLIDRVPVVWQSEKLIAEEIELRGVTFEMTCISMGNPHAVLFLPDESEVDILDDKQVLSIGPFLENHTMFPKRTNVEFVHVIDDSTIQMRVWERGTGETYACGTGACATVAACILTGRTKEAATVKLIGGDLFVEYSRKKDVMMLTGPAEEVFRGEWIEKTN